MMKRCSVKPYEGEEPFVFISYCHKDRAHIFPIIENKRFPEDSIGMDQHCHYSKQASSHPNYHDQIMVLYLPI